MVMYFTPQFKIFSKKKSRNKFNINISNISKVNNFFRENIFFSNKNIYVIDGFS